MKAKEKLYKVWDTAMGRYAVDHTHSEAKATNEQDAKDFRDSLNGCVPDKGKPQRFVIRAI